MANGFLQPSNTPPLDTNQATGGGAGTLPPENRAHPLYGLSVADRTESRQRVLATALAEILRSNARTTTVSVH